MLPKVLVALVAAPLCAATASAAIVDVFPTSPDALQNAIDAANPGDVLRIHGGTYDPITITKSLELIAEPQATVVGVWNPVSPSSQAINPISIGGPGSGVLTLQNIRTSGGYNVSQFVPPNRPPRVVMSGFDQVRMIDCEVTGPGWGGADQIEGAPGIRSFVPELILSGTTVTAMNPCTNQVPPVAPTPAIEAPDTTIAAVDCDVEGGYYFVGLTAFNCAPPYDTKAVGGPGIVCKRLFQTGGSIRGGAGGQWFCSSDGSFLEQSPDGLGVVALEHVVQMQSLRQTVAPTLGGSWTLEAKAGPSGGFLRIAIQLGPLEFNPLAGWNWVETPQVFFAQGTAPYFQELTLPVTPNVNLLGLDLVAEVYDNAYGRFGGPVITQIR